MDVEIAEKVKLIEDKIHKLESSKQFINTLRGVLGEKVFKTSFVNTFQATNNSDIYVSLPQEIIPAEGQRVYLMHSSIIFLSNDSGFPAFGYPEIIDSITGNPDVLKNGDFVLFKDFFINPTGDQAIITSHYLAPLDLYEGDHTFKFHFYNQYNNTSQINCFIGFIYLP